VNLSPSVWLRENRGVYFGNASSMRDYRVQLRGSRSVLLFGTYLIFLISIALLVYSNSTRSGASVSIVDAQQSLRSFYQVVIGLLGGMICLVTPALSATAIISERQRKSLDLVFSAPVSPKYYLVGKMLSSYRYTWMLLVLSLPVTAACVVLGGASWSDVLIAYALLSVHGIIFSALALLISAASIKPVSAIVSSYGGAFAYCVFSSIVGGISLLRPFMGSGMNEQPFVCAFSPFLASQSAPTYTILFGVHVSNVVFVAISALLFSRLCLLAAGAILRPYGGTEVQSLRLNGLLYFLGVMGLTGYSLATTMTMSKFQVQTIGQMMAVASSVLLVIVPNLAAFGYDGERRFWPSGPFSLPQIFSGRPGGTLPYLLCLTVGGCLAYLGGYALNSSVTTKLGIEISAFILFTTGFWILIYALGRFCSAITLLGKSARGGASVIFLVITFIPPILFNSLDAESAQLTTFNAWDLYILRPLMVQAEPRFWQAGLYGGVMLGIGLAIHFAAERQLARTIQKGTNPYASIAATQTV
jgi:hypothetical protein